MPAGESPWIDVSVPLRPGVLHWPGDPPFELERISEIAKGDLCDVSAVRMSSHTGTHLDAPRHFLRDGAGIDRLPLDALIGPALVIEIADRRTILPAELARHAIPRGARVLFKTRNGELWDGRPFTEDYVAVSPEAAEWLVEQEVKLVGVDYLSVGPAGDAGAHVHCTLLSAGVCIVESLQLASITPGDYDLVCLPLNLLDADGAPARALLRRR